MMGKRLFKKTITEMAMKRLIVMLTAGLAMLALGACGKQETKPQEGTTENTTQQAQPSEEQKPAEEPKAEETKPSAQADQYNAVAQAEPAAADAVPETPTPGDEEATTSKDAESTGQSQN
jgi:hypothetical protein